MISKEALQSRYTKEEIYFFERYPYLFVQVNSPVSMSCMPWGLDIEKGWHPLLEKLCRQITFLYKLGINTEFTQVKEKMAGMRIYHVSYRVRFIKLHQLLRRYFFVPVGNRIFVGPNGDKKPFHKTLWKLYNFMVKVNSILCINPQPDNGMSDDMVSALIHDIARQSEQTCEVCGEYGRTRTTGSWLKTLCDVHTKELKYKEIKNG
jgi:hypothetical protein